MHITKKFAGDPFVQNVGVSYAKLTVVVFPLYQPLNLIAFRPLSLKTFF